MNLEVRKPFLVDDTNCESHPMTYVHGNASYVYFDRGGKWSNDMKSIANRCFVMEHNQGQCNY